MFSRQNPQTTTRKTYQSEQPNTTTCAFPRPFSGRLHRTTQPKPFFAREDACQLSASPWSPADKDQRQRDDTDRRPLATKTRCRNSPPLRINILQKQNEAGCKWLLDLVIFQMSQTEMNVFNQLDFWFPTKNAANLRNHTANLPKLIYQIWFTKKLIYQNIYQKCNQMN